MKTDYVVVGSGIAGLRVVLELRKHGKSVVLITKRSLRDSNTFYAQGGISSVSSQNSSDSFEKHTVDTIQAGDGLCRMSAVKTVVHNSPVEVIDYLAERGMSFTKIVNSFSLHQEGGHSQPRIYHTADYTGKAIVETLVQQVLADSGVTVLEHHYAIDLVLSDDRRKCYGVFVYDLHSKQVLTIGAKATFLATGGAGRVYLYTSNPDVTTGDGIAMAYRAGLPVMNMEFIQFHPTCLYNPSAITQHDRRFLITEALRGKNVGGILTLHSDEREDFVLRYHKNGSASTRDVVARAIDAEMKKKGLDHVYLNVSTTVTGKTEQELQYEFPDIFKMCQKIGINISYEPIPVVPAAHYTIGGVAVRCYGETAMPGLYVIGEAACTGLHGANRLASNSLPEGAIYGKLAVQHALKYKAPTVFLPEWDAGSATKSEDEVQVHHAWQEVRSLMWNLVGIVRTEECLLMAKRRLELIQSELQKYYWQYTITPSLLELRNITQVALLIVDAALQRRESRGAHYRLDYPGKVKGFAQPSVLKKVLSQQVRL